MDQIMEEYGGIFLGVFTGVFVLASVFGLVFSGGILGELMILFGNAAC